MEIPIVSLAHFHGFEGFSSHPKHGSGEMYSCVHVAVKIVIGLNPYLEEGNRDLLQLCIKDIGYGCTKGEFFSESAIRFLDLQISKKNYYKFIS